MEPRLPSPNAGLERPSLSSGEKTENAPLVYNPESYVERMVERHERPDGVVVDNGAKQPVLPPPAVITVQSAAVKDDVATDVSSGDTPLVANDDDLIEKEWVDKAKRIIIDTKDDPYRREQEVSRLQADYLRKRYGRELGTFQY